MWWGVPAAVHFVITVENIFLCSRDKRSSRWSGLAEDTRSSAFTHGLSGDLAPPWCPAPLLIHPLRSATSVSPDSLKGGSKRQLLRILTTFSTTFLPFYQDNNMQFQYISVICCHAVHDLSWSAFAAFITWHLFWLLHLLQGLRPQIIHHLPCWCDFFIIVSQRESQHLNTLPKSNVGSTLRLAEHAKLSRYFWKSCTWRRGCSCSLLCNRDHYEWETIKQLAGTHFCFKTPEQPAEITYTAYILWWMFSFSICTKVNYRKLLHLFTLENLKGKQPRPPSKNISLKGKGHSFSRSALLVHIFQFWKDGSGALGETDLDQELKYLVSLL